MKPPSGSPPTRPAPSRLERLVARARLVIRLERVWPLVVLAGGIVAVFVALSWLGLWVALPRALRVAGVALFAAGLVAAAVLLARQLAVSRRDALARLDRDAGGAHRPVSAAEDRLANAGPDPLTQALWQLSRQRLDGTLARLRLRPPAPRLAARDPYALRAAALLGLVAAGFVAGAGKDGLIAAAFDWRGAVPAGAGFRVDAWIDPPGYTGRAPVVLLGGSAAPSADQAVTVPIRSSVVVRASGAGAVQATVTGGLKASPAPSPAPKPAAAASRPADAPAGGDEHRFTLDGSGRLALLHDGAPLAGVTLTALPDLPPTIVLLEPPRPTARGGLTLGYKIDDDYGVTRAEAAFTDPVSGERPIVRSLVAPPKLDLNLPPTPGGLGTGQTTGDLSDHPWAGAEVTVVLSTGDEGGNIGLSAPVRMTLPARTFANPLARALVEQRRDLVFDPDHREGVGTALDALMIDPDRFGTSKAVYLGLYTARTRLASARTDEDLIGLADYLWQMALRIEEGDKSVAARDLQAAEQALREALQRGASPDEIKRLTEALRQQMDRFLAELAERSRTAQAGTPPDPNAHVVTPQQLQEMMRRMGELAQNGDTAEARRMLDQLQAMLDNLRPAKPGTGQAQREINRQMSELDKMSRDQQALRDRTFRQGRPKPSQDGQPFADDPDEADDGAPVGDPRAEGEPQAQGDQPGGDDLAGQQGGLRDRLDALQRRMRQLGLKGEQGLENAEQAMKDAEGALGQGKPGNRRAVEAQGRALQGLQQGANGLAQQMASQPGEGQQQGEGEGTGGPSISQGSAGQDGNDPLGRTRDGRGRMETRGRALGEGVAERAQRVLQELRRRLGDPGRSSEELEYLERLLQHY